MPPIKKVVARDNRTAEDSRQTINLGRILRYSARRNPKKPAIICGDQIVSYEALDRFTDEQARWLLKQGYKGRLSLPQTRSRQEKVKYGRVP